TDRQPRLQLRRRGAALHAQRRRRVRPDDRDGDPRPERRRVRRPRRLPRRRQDRRRHGRSDGGLDHRPDEADRARVMIATLARKSLRARVGRSIFTGLAILAGVAFVAGSFVLADSLKATFDDLIDGLTGDLDLQVRSELTVDELDAVRDPLPATIVDEVAAVPGVAVAEPGYGRFAQMLDPDGDPVITQGAPTLGVSWDPDSGLSGVVLKAGRAPQG